MSNSFARRLSKIEEALRTARLLPNLAAFEAASGKEKRAMLRAMSDEELALLCGGMSAEKRERLAAMTDEELHACIAQLEAD